jgi:hypothetical protein
VVVSAAQPALVDGRDVDHGSSDRDCIKFVIKHSAGAMASAPSEKAEDT